MTVVSMKWVTNPNRAVTNPPALAASSPSQPAATDCNTDMGAKLIGQRSVNNEGVGDVQCARNQASNEYRP